MNNSNVYILEFDHRFKDFGTSHQQIDDGGIFMCMKGEAGFFLNMKYYKLKAGDLCVAFPKSIIQPVKSSEDFEGIGVGVDINLFTDIQLPSMIDYYLFIRDNPCIPLTDDQQSTLIDLCRLLTNINNNKAHPFRQEITLSIFKIIYCEIAAIYKKGTPKKQETVSRKEYLIRSFLYLVAGNFKNHRDVDYYARELCISPRYLSSVLKEKTGNGALYWINDSVINKAKSLLHDSRLTILQISEELNFANPSFFGQYFKKHTGMTPKKYRNMV
jgi:AraC-like DNA-binding protein